MTNTMSFCVIGITDFVWLGVQILNGTKAMLTTSLEDLQDFLRLEAKNMGKMFKINGILIFSLILVIASKQVEGFFFTKTNIMIRGSKK